MLRKILTLNYLKVTNSRLNDTIYALATGTGTAVSIIRISGSNAYRALEILNKSQNDTHLNRSQIIDLHKIQPRRAHFKNVFNKQGNLIDKCLLLYFPAPHSYNSEQILQFHTHGSKAIVSSIFKQLNQKGFRMADRGQFTKRGLLNGKINIGEAEAIDDLIKSQSEFQRQIAINNMLGKSKQFIDSFKQQLIKCLANNEAYIDFQDQQKDVTADLIDSTKQRVSKLLQQLQKIFKNYENLQRIKQGINIVITGKPNAGKSTLINALSNKQIAIVSQEPGTTRDILHAQIDCDGILVNLYDTAGLREAKSKIQKQGIRRAKEKFKQCQIGILVIDLEQEQINTKIREDGVQEVEIVNKGGEGEVNYNQLIDQNTIIIINKSDRLPQRLKQNAQFFIKTEKMITPKVNYFDEPEQPVPPPQIIKQTHKIQLVISSQNNSQINILQSYLSKTVSKKYSLYSNSDNSSNQIYFSRQRYFQKLQRCKTYLQAYIEQNRADIGCQYLRQALKQVSQIFGKVDVQEVLDVLFKQFCIGK